MNFYNTKRAFEYFLFSHHRKGHGIHSPYIYKLVSEVFKNKTESSVVNKVERIRSDLKKCNQRIDFTDLGAGSLKLNSRIRSISDIAKYSSLRPRYASLLSRLAGLVNGKVIIELGTSLGISTMYMALAAPLSKIYTVEGCKEVADIAESNFELCGIRNVETVRGNFDDMLGLLLERTGQPGMVFIDGNHRKEPLLRYFHMLKGLSSNSSILVIDDIHYSRQMEEAWDEIKRSKDVSVTIDIFQMGMVFFRQGMSKQNYIIRY